MNLVEELQKLEQLYQNGSLTASEYAQAKATLLSTSSLNAQNSRSNNLTHEAFLEKETLLARLDREWELEKQKYMAQGKYGSTYLPNAAMGIVMATVVGLFGTFWTIMAFGFTNQVSNNTESFPFNLFKIVFPLFGVLFTLGGIWMGLNQYQKASEYQVALQNYQTKRDQILNR